MTFQIYPDQWMNLELIWVDNQLDVHVNQKKVKWPGILSKIHDPVLRREGGKKYHLQLKPYLRQEEDGSLKTGLNEVVLTVSNKVGDGKANVVEIDDKGKKGVVRFKDKELKWDWDSGFLKFEDNKAFVDPDSNNPIQFEARLNIGSRTSPENITPGWMFLHIPGKGSQTKDAEPIRLWIEVIPRPK